METIAKVKTPMRVCKVVKMVDICGKDVFQIWDQNRHRYQHTFYNEFYAIQFMLQRAAGDYMQTNLFNLA